MSVKWGLLSTALINEAILAGAAESSEVDVIGVASRDEARAQDFAREHGIERAYGLVRAVSPRVDADRSMSADVAVVAQAIRKGEFDGI